MRGNPGKRPLYLAAKPERSIPRAPRYLGKAAKAIFLELAEELDAIHVNAAPNRRIIALAAMALEEVEQLYTFIDEHGRTVDVLTVAGSKALGAKAPANSLNATLPGLDAAPEAAEPENMDGLLVPRMRPEVAQLNDALRRAQSALGELGLTPSTRSKVSALISNQQRSALVDHINRKRRA